MTDEEKKLQEISTTERDALRARIESAPVLYLWWRRDVDGNRVLVDAAEDADWWRGRTFREGDTVERVRAVVVESEGSDEQS